MNQEYNKNKNALLILGSHLLLDKFDWYDDNIEQGIIGSIDLDHIKSFFSKEKSYLSKSRDEYLYNHTSIMFSKKLSTIKPKFKSLENGITSVIYSDKAKKLSKEDENYLVNLGLVQLIHDDSVSTIKNLEDIKQLLLSVDKILDTNHMYAYTNTYMSNFVTHEYNWKGGLFRGRNTFENSIKVLLKNIKRELDKLNYNISQNISQQNPSYEKNIKSFKSEKKSILKSLNILCKRLCEKSFVKKEKMALYLLEIDIDFVEIGFETNPSFIDSIKEYVKSEDQDPVRRAKFYSYFSKEDFLRVIERQRKNKNRDLMVELIKMSSNIGFIDKKQARYIRSETSDKRAKVMVESLMKNFSKIVDKQIVLAMLSDIKHVGAYVKLIELVPKSFLFMFVGNPIRKDYRAKEIFERRMM